MQDIKCETSAACKCVFHIFGLQTLFLLLGKHCALFIGERWLKLERKYFCWCQVEL